MAIHTQGGVVKHGEGKQHERARQAVQSSFAGSVSKSRMVDWTLSHTEGCTAPADLRVSSTTSGNH